MEELDLKELFQIFLEKKLQIILITLIFIAIGIIYSVGFVVPKYESTTTLLLATNNNNLTVGATGITTTDVTLNSNLVSTYSELLKTKKIIRNAISNLAIDAEEEDIEKNVSIAARSDSQVIDIKVKNEDPVLSAKITNEISKVFVETVKEYYKIENVYIVDEAEVNDEPVNVNHIRDVIIFAFIGIVVASIYVLVANMLDTTIKTSEDIEKIAGGITVLATVPVYDMSEDKNKNNKRKGVRR